MWESAVEHFGLQRLENLQAHPYVRISPSLRHAENKEFVITCLKQEFDRLSSEVAHGQEVSDALKDLDNVNDEALTWRLAQSAKTLEQAGKGPGEDKQEYTTAQNGAKLRRKEQDTFNNLLEQISFGKGRQN